jgi:capsular exopolysaccharide synthesis family protein
MIQSLGLVRSPEMFSPEACARAGSSTPQDPEKTWTPDDLPVEEVVITPRMRIVYQTDPRGVAADRFRHIRMRLRELWNTGKLKKLLIASPLPQDGKSTVALNLATVLTERGKKSVLLIDADLYHPVLIDVLGLKPGPGLAECLENGLSPLSALRRIAPLGWCLLPAGKPTVNPSELLHNGGLAEILHKLSSYFDWILVDSPPMTPLTDALALAQQTDASLVVVRAGRTPLESVKAVVAALPAKHVAGVILNGVAGLERLYSKYYGCYRYE